MYSRLRDGLFSPRSIIDYIKDKMYRPFIQLLLYALLMIIPVVINNLNYSGLSYNTRNQISELFNGDTISFKIVDGELSSTNTNDLIYTKSLTELIDIRISEVESNQMTTKYVIELSKEKVSLKFAGISMYSVNYSEYEDIKNIDLSKLSNPSANEWDLVFSVVNSLLKQYYKDTIVVTSIMSFIEYFVFLLIFTLIISTSFLFRFRHVLKYSAMFKMSAYYTAPFVLGMVLTNLFSISVFYVLGLIVSFVYTFIGSTTIISRLLNQSRK